MGALGRQRAPDFRFSVKLPKTISHQRKLVDCSDDLARFLGEVGGLGAKLGALLLQLPPKLAFEARVAETFLSEARERCAATLVCEPRHPSWFEPEADAMLNRLGIPRVAADPAPVAAGALPGGSRHISYWRLHGSPHMYRSTYDDGRLEHYAALLQADHEAGRTAWCIFDNTASSAAIHNALIIGRCSVWERRRGRAGLAGERRRARARWVTGGRSVPGPAPPP